MGAPFGGGPPQPHPQRPMPPGMTPAGNQPPGMAAPNPFGSEAGSYGPEAGFGGMEPPPRGRGEDSSGIVSTYEDMQRNENFKTRKLPLPGEKKKGFFDGLFKRDK